MYKKLLYHCTHAQIGNLCYVHSLWAVFGLWRFCCINCHFPQTPFFLFSMLHAARTWGWSPVIAFFYHLPQIYKWLFKPYYILSTLMSTAFLILRKCPGLCENLNTEREDRNRCDFDLVSIRVAWQRCCAKSSGLWCYCKYLFYNTLYVILWGLTERSGYSYVSLCDCHDEEQERQYILNEWHQFGQVAGVSRLLSLKISHMFTV